MLFYPLNLRVFLVSVPLLSLWSKRYLIFYFSIMNVKLRYKGTNLGFFWNVLEPIKDFADSVMLILQGRMIKIGEPNEVIEKYKEISKNKQKNDL